MERKLESDRIKKEEISEGRFYLPPQINFQLDMQPYESK